MFPKHKDILLHNQSPVVITSVITDLNLTLIKYFYRMYSPYSDFLHHLGDVHFSSERYFLRPSTPRDEKQPLALISEHLRIRSILCHDELILREYPRTMCVTRCKTHFRTCRSAGTFRQHYPNTNNLWL